MMFEMKRTAFFILLILGISSLISLIHFPEVKAIIWIDGRITSDTTWTPLDTYRMINELYVDSGVTLTIEPDVRIEIGDGFSLIVEGSFNATGTESNPIIFTSTPRPSPDPGIWNTIEFAGNKSESFTLKHATVEYGICGVTVQCPSEIILEKNGIYNCSYSSIYIVEEENLRIIENTLKHNYNGISTDARKAHSDILIENNSIYYNARASSITVIRVGKIILETLGIMKRAR